MALFTKKRQYAPQDFKFENLPQTRRAQFKDLLKHRFGLITKIGLVITLFCIPLIITIIFEQYFKTSFYQMYLAEEITGKEYAGNTFVLTLILDIFYLIDFLTAAVCLSGVTRILRQLIWGEAVYFWHDFKIGVKQSCKNFLLNGFYFWLIFAISSVISVYFGMFSIFGFLMIVLCIFFFIPLFLVNMVYVPVYDSTIKAAHKNSFLMCLYMKFKSVLWGLVFVAPALILLIPYTTIPIILFLVILLLVYPVILLGFNLFMYDVFDKALNLTHYKDIVRKGLYNGLNNQK